MTRHIVGDSVPRANTAALIDVNGCLREKPANESNPATLRLSAKERYEQWLSEPSEWFPAGLQILKYITVNTNCDLLFLTGSSEKHVDKRWEMTLEAFYQIGVPLNNELMERIHLVMRPEWLFADTSFIKLKMLLNHVMPRYQRIDLVMDDNQDFLNYVRSYFPDIPVINGSYFTVRERAWTPTHFEEATSPTASPQQVGRLSREGFSEYACPIAVHMKMSNKGINPNAITNYR